MIKIVRLSTDKITKEICEHRILLYGKIVNKYSYIWNGVKHWYIDKIIEEKTLHKAGSSAVNDITLEMEENRKEKKSYFKQGICIWSSS